MPEKVMKIYENQWFVNDLFMSSSLLFRAYFLKFVLMFFDCFPNCANLKNIENSLVLIQYFALGTFRKRTNKIKNNAKTQAVFALIFHQKSCLFRVQNQHGFLHGFFIENGLQK